MPPSRQAHRPLPRWVYGFLAFLGPLALAVVWIALGPSRGDSMSAEERYAHVVAEGLDRAARGDDRGASDSFGEAVDLFPGRPAAHAWLAQSLFRQGRYPEAVEAAVGALRWDEEDHGLYARSAILLQAEALVRLGRLEEAVATARELLERRPGDPGAHESYQRARLARGERDLLLAEVRAKLEEPDCPLSFDYRYLLHARLVQDDALALEICDKGLAMEAGSGRDELLLEAAERLGRSGRWDEAVERAGKLPWAPRVPLVLAKALVAQGKVEDAVRLLEKDLEGHGGSPPLFRALAYTLLASARETRYGDAGRFFARAREPAGDLDPFARSLYLVESGIVAREEGEFERAARLFEEARGAHGYPDRSRRHAACELLLTRFEAGALEEVEALAPSLSEELSGDPELGLRVELVRGMALLEAGDPVGARRAWSEAIARVERTPLGEEGEPRAAIRFLLEAGPLGERLLRYRDEARVAGEPTLENNVLFVAGLREFMDGHGKEATARFVSACGASLGRNFPYYAARRWADTAR